MSDNDEWRPINGFPDYLVSPQGMILSHKTDHILSGSRTQQGHVKVNLYKKGVLFTRNVNHLVARAYLDRPQRSDFTSVIHLDGDKTNLAALNLMWRPRYFAVKYHLQFEYDYYHRASVAIKDIKTGEVYSRIQKAVVQHGLLLQDILISMHNRTFVWPTYQEFTRIEA